MREIKHTCDSLLQVISNFLGHVIFIRGVGLNLESLNILDLRENIQQPWGNDRNWPSRSLVGDTKGKLVSLRAFESEFSSDKVFERRS